MDEVLKGSAPAGAVTVTTVELAYAPPHTEWRQPEKRVVLLLSPSTETPGLYFPTKASYDQTAYILQGDDLENA